MRSRRRHRFRQVILAALAAEHRFRQAERRYDDVLSHAVFNDRSGTVIAVIVTSVSQTAGFPLTLPVPAGLLPKPSWVKVSQIRTISIKRLRGRLGQGPPELLDAILEGISELIGA